MSEYRTFSNYPTWRVYDHVLSDYGVFSRLSDLRLPMNPDLLAYIVRRKNMPDVISMNNDMLAYAWQSVNWQEVVTRVFEYIAEGGEFMGTVE